MKSKFLIGLFICLFQPFDGLSNNLVINVLDVGAVADTTIVSTEYFQKALDSCYLNGGGKVVVPVGAYCIGTIVLKANTTIQIDSGAIIYASRSINDYRSPLSDATKPVLIYANGAFNINITGRGEINGRARRQYLDLKKVDRYIVEVTENAKSAGVEMKQYYKLKPHVGLLNLVNCKNVRLTNITVRESCFWSVHFVGCTQVIIDSLNVYSSLEKGVNADGIDINNCRNVVIKNCEVFTGDDAIVIKSRYKKESRNILVENCRLKSSSTALKIGTETKGDFSNIRFQNCTIEDANRGLSIVVLDGGRVDSILFKNIVMSCSRRHFNWWGNADPIWLNVSKRYESSLIGSIKNVWFEDIYAQAMGSSKVEGDTSGVVSNVHFENIQIEIRAENYLDKRCDDALVFKNVSKSTLMNILIKWEDANQEPKWKSAFTLSNVTELYAEDISVRQGLVRTLNPAIQINNSRDVEFKNLEFQKGTLVGIQVEGEHTEKIRIEKVSKPGSIKELIRCTSADRQNEIVTIHD